MSSPQGINKKIMTRIIQQLENALHQYSRILVVRIDFHCADYIYNNSLMSNFMKKLLVILKERYKCDIRYVWVREQVDSKTPHYHSALMLNGHKVNHPARIIKTIEQQLKNNNQLSFFLPENCYYQVQRTNIDVQAAVIFRLSYLAKNRTKGDRPICVRDYSTSHY